MIRRSTLVIAFIVASLMTSTATAGAQTRRRDAPRTTPDALVEAKDDRFTGKRTVRMLPVRVTPHLEMELSGELNLAPPRDALYRETEDSSRLVEANFILSADAEMEFGVSRIDWIFLVDGARTSPSTAQRTDAPGGRQPIDTRKGFGVAELKVLEQVAAGRKVEMRLGTTEIVLDDATLMSIRAFVKALQR